MFNQLILSYVARRPLHRERETVPYTMKRDLLRDGILMTFVALFVYLVILCLWQYQSRTKAVKTRYAVFLYRLVNVRTF